MRSARDLILQEIVFSFVYPRLDIAVSRHVNHLLKSPFCAHPKTGRLCVPVDAARIDAFVPDKVPHLGQLDAELNAGGNTSLAPYLSFFRKKFLHPLQASCRAHAAQQRRSAPDLTF